MILINIIIIIFLFLIALYQKKLFLLIFLLISTDFIGLINVNDVRLLAIYPFVNVMFAIILYLIYVFVSKPKLHFQQIRPFYWLITIYLVLLIYGLIKPIIFFNTSLLNSLTDGREFLSFLLLPFLLVNRKHYPSTFIINALLLFSLLLALSFYFPMFTNQKLPGYFTYFNDLNLIASKIKFPSYLSLTLILLVFVDNRNFNLIKIGALILIFSVIIFQGHRAVFIVTILVGFLSSFVVKKSRSYQLGVIFTIFLLIISILTFELLMNFNLIKYIVYASNEFFYQKGAIESRNYVDIIRWDLFGERPLWGYGFIDENSSLGSYIENQSTSGYNQTLTTVDSGYLDLLVRFGVIGTSAFILSLLYSNFRMFRYSKTLVFFNMSFFILLFTWSVLTYSMGLIPLGISLYLIKDEHLKQSFNH